MCLGDTDDNAGEAACRSVFRKGFQLKFRRFAVIRVSLYLEHEEQAINASHEVPESRVHERAPMNLKKLAPEGFLQVQADVSLKPRLGLLGHHSLSR